MDSDIGNKVRDLRRLRTVADSQTDKRIVDMIVAPTMFGRTATFDDVGNVAAFVCSDRAMNHPWFDAASF